MPNSPEDTGYTMVILGISPGYIVCLHMKEQRVLKAVYEYITDYQQRMYVFLRPQYILPRFHN